MQVPILSGIYSDGNSDFRTAFPQNLIPVPHKQGISNGYLRPSYGVDTLNTAIGKDSGAIEWRGDAYRLANDTLFRINENGTVTSFGFGNEIVNPNGPIAATDRPEFAIMAHSFDDLAIAIYGNLYLFSPDVGGGGLRQVTDANLGKAYDVVFLDGYFVTTDGEALVTGTLGDPDTIPPLSYQSSEVDPDPIIGLLVHRNEVVALNRHTIEFFDNVGGDGITTPLRRIEGAQIERGLFARHAKCIFDDKIAFVGGGKNEQIGVYLGQSGGSVKISTREVDKIIKAEIDAFPVSGDGFTIFDRLKLETLNFDNLQTLYIHLTNKSLCYDLQASRALGSPIWYEVFRGTAENPELAYVNIIHVHNKWMVGQHNARSGVGYLTEEHSIVFGDNVSWSFTTPITYNEGNGFSVYEAKLQFLHGRATLGADPVIYTRFSNDYGLSWSKPKPKRAADAGGNFKKRLEWARQGDTDEVRIQQFYGTSDAHVSIARLDMQLQPSAF